MFFFFSFLTLFGFSFHYADNFTYCFKGVIFLHTVSRKHLFPFATSFFYFIIVSLVTCFTIPLEQCPPNIHFKFAYSSSLFLLQQKAQLPLNWAPPSLLRTWPQKKLFFSLYFFLISLLLFQCHCLSFPQPKQPPQSCPCVYHLPTSPSLNFP